LDKDEGVFAKYISRILGRLSSPKMQNSMKLRLKIEKDEPAQKGPRFTQPFSLTAGEK